MTIRALVAVCDGLVMGDGIGLAPGCISEDHALPIPVVLDFDSRRVVGRAALELEGHNVFARLELLDTTPIVGRWPALGLQMLAAVSGRGLPGAIYTRVAVLAISLGKNRNADPRVPPLDLGGPIVV